MAKKNSPKPAADLVRTLGRVVSFFFFGILFVTVIRYVDDRYQVDAQLAMQEGLLGANSENQLRLQEYRSNAKTIEASIEEWKKRTVEETGLNGVQDKLVALAKKFQCTLKKASPRGKLVRDFEMSTNEKLGLPQNGPQANKEAEFEFHEAGLAVSVEGNLKNAMSFLEAIKQERWVCSTNQLVIRRNPGRSGQVDLELELGFQSLHKKVKNNTEGNIPSAAPRA